MGDQKVQRHCIDLKLGQDFISILPQPLKDNILMRLNIIEAVRTSILSKEWRYTWCTMPKLVIITAYFNVVTKERKLDCNKIIDSLLLHHNGPITEFILSIDNFHHDNLDRWIHVLGNKGVKDLSFNFDMTDSCEIPSSFLSCLLTLTNLKFSSRTLDVPQLFRGFKMLRTLELNIATIASADLERLVSRCPLLQFLKLVNMFEGFNNLVIQSQSLETIVVIANYKHFVLDTPKLYMLGVTPNNSHFNCEEFKNVLASYETYPDGLPDPNERNKCFLVRHFKSMTRKLPIKLNHLTQMVITINVSKEDDFVAVLFLLKSAPKLQNLHVKLYSKGDLGAYCNCKSFWESEANNVLFNDLKTVIIQPSEPATADSTIAIIKFILSTARVLECMIIRDRGVAIMMTSMKNPSLLELVSRIDAMVMRNAMATVLEVLKLPRLSNKATITFEESDIFGLYGAV